MTLEKVSVSKDDVESSRVSLPSLTMGAYLAARSIDEEEPTVHVGLDSYVNYDIRLL
ncbi:hypothetical protein GJ744_008257 [Endocarpon pusillum]|uniref:Uncharacterized protein n=1 Tax=Endocarpon pusillum TaxID=364733 RepID=A0A8H7ALL9_9EURO|nr:hypothetical protein GJ744_008257 [Endocarpon pusillum]